MKGIALLMLLFFVHCGLAQGQVTIRHLVFEAAGIRGIAYSGALQEMESNQLMNHIEKVGGTSSGAIMALAVSLGYSGKEIEEMISQTNFRKFNDGRYLFIGGINRVKKYFGWFRGEKLEKCLEKLIWQKTGKANITFGELHARGFRDLYVAGTCLNKQRPVIFSYETYPGMKVKDAIRISTSIPLYFEAVFLDSAGNRVSHPKNKRGLNVMMDGGFLESFPIHIFDGDQADPSTIGLRIDPEGQVRSDRINQELVEVPVTNAKQYAMALYTLVSESLNRPQLTRADWDRTISISDGDVAPRLRKLSNEEKKILIENGRKAVRDYLSK